MNSRTPLDTAPGRYWAWRPSAAIGEPALSITGRAERLRLAIVTTHPIQYHAPWFRALTREPELDVHVFYCHRSGVHEQGAGFNVPFAWDIPLLDGYSHSFLTNVSAQPGTDRFNGLNTPEIAHIIAAGAFDVVLVNGWHYRSAWQAIQACWRSHVPVMARGDSHLHSPRSLLRKIAKEVPFRAFIPRLQGCAAVGSWSRDYFLHYGASPRRIFRIPHIVDVERIVAQSQAFRPQRLMLRQRWNLPERAVVFAFAGKLIDKKRPLDFIRAVARAQSEEPNLGGLIIGDGPLRSACEQEIKRSGATVRLAGFLNQSEIVAGYCAADALVLPSDGGETWGLVVNEAMACGLPCLVSDHVGCGPDLIANQGTGAIFRLADVEQLAGTMAAWARDGAHVSSMGAQARKLSTSFTPEIAARATFEMCQAIAPTRLRRASSAAV